jgi:hypothetical protein
MPASLMGGGSAVESFARLGEIAAVDKTGQRMSGRLRSTTSKPSQARKHGLGLGEVYVRHFAAIAAVPPQRRRSNREGSESSSSTTTSNASASPTCGRSAAAARAIRALPVSSA